jgi:uroporphyrinogen III methyltransferase/synthase
VKGRTRREAAILIVGRVVGLRKHLRWYDAKPLFGLKVLVTRAREQAAELSDQLAAFGAEPVEAPMIRILPPDDSTPLLRAAAQLDVFDWIVFTSANAVDSLMKAVIETGGDVRSLKGPQLCAIGSATAEQLAKYGIKVDLIPPEFRADAVVRALETRGPLDAVRVLLPRADIGREVIAEQLRDAGSLVTDVVAYRTVLDDGNADGGPDIYRMLLDGEIQIVTFTSASAVRNFTKVLGAEQAADLLKKTIVAAIGPVTAEAAGRLGIEVTVQPTSYTVPALVEAIVAHVVARKAAS